MVVLLFESAVQADPMDTPTWWQSSPASRLSPLLPGKVALIDPGNCQGPGASLMRTSGQKRRMPSIIICRNRFNRCRWVSIRRAARSAAVPNPTIW